MYWGTDSARVAYVAVLSVFALLALVAVICRLWARKIQRSKYEVNDWLCLVGLVFALSLSVFSMHDYIYWNLGGDQTQYNSPKAVLSQVILGTKAMLVGETLWVATVSVVRASILSLYVRIFQIKPFRTACYVVHGINFSYLAATVLSTCLICRPISAFWNPKTGTCGDQKSLDLFIGIFNLIMDITVVVLPLPVVWRLQMTTAKKIALSAIFGMGIVICVVTLVRVWVTTLIRPDNSQKMYSLIAFLTSLEAILGVIESCLPVVRPVFTKLGNSKVGSSFMSSLSSNRFSPFSRPSIGTRSGIHSRTQRSNGQADSEMSNLPSLEQKLAPRFVDNKAAPMMFSYCNPSTSIVSGGGPPRYPLKSKFHHSDWTRDDRKGPGITVQRDWDVERADSQEIEIRPLRDDCERMW